MQIRRDVLPALVDADVKLACIGIGSAEAAKTFAEKTDFPAALLYSDESETVEAHSAMGTRNTQRDASGKAVFEGVESMWSKATNEALKARGRDDLNAVVGSLFKPGVYVPLMPTGKGLFDPRVVEKTMVQGGAFVYDGPDELFAHFDASSGAHVDLEELVRVATAERQ